MDSPDPVGIIACRGAAPYFPSADMPILDVSIVSVEDGAPRFLRVAGLAADGVAGIAILDASGQQVQTIPVVSNVYATDTVVPRAGIRIAALDAQGAVIARVPPE
jgi:hypothetical protein